jgi:hypothetical protein
VKNSPPFETTIKSKRRKRMVGNKTPSPTYTHNKISRANIPLLLHDEEQYNGEKLHFCVPPLLETTAERKENKRS